MNKFYYFLILLLISSCTAEVETNEEEDNSATGVEIVFEQGLGENPTQFVANWNILVNEISEDEETLLYFSIKKRNILLILKKLRSTKNIEIVVLLPKPVFFSFLP